MPSFDQHCQETRELLGDEFADVHRWMDALFGTHGPMHRRFRHNQAGIEEVRRRWGSRAAKAARLHIMADLKEQGWVEGRHRLPRDEQDYIGMGLV